MTGEGNMHVDLSRIGAEPLSEGDPRQIGPFPLCAVLGSGGMGRVYLGITPDGYAAVKQVLPHFANDAAFRRHFGQELDSQARLPAGIGARLLAADRTARPPWFATEYLPGVTLHEAVYVSGGQLPAPVVWRLLRELAGRLERVGRLDLVHRDLKPSNVMLTDDGCRLIDFGIARALDQSSLTTSGKVVGTPGYMSPEQARADRALTPAADVFALGGMLAFAATGEAPFGNGSGTDVLYRIVHQQPDLSKLRALDAELADAVESCLVKDPAARPSATDLAGLAAAHLGPEQKQKQEQAQRWPSPIDRLIATRRAFAEETVAAREPESVPEPNETAAEEEETTPDPGSWAGERSDSRAAAPAGDRSHGPDAQRSSSEERRRLRRRAAILVPLLVIGGTAGTLVALHDVPFASANQSGSTGGDTGNLLPSSSATAASAGASASRPGSGDATPTAGQSRSVSAAAGGATVSVTLQPAAGGVSTKNSAPAAHTSAASSGGSGGSGTSDPAVVSTTYSEIKNVGQSDCVDGQAGGTVRSCDGSSAVQYHEVSTSGGFRLESASGECLDNAGADATAASCSVLNPSTLVWTIGTRTTRGGQLKNGGECLAWTTTAMGDLGMVACNSADPDQLWYAASD